MVNINQITTRITDEKMGPLYGSDFFRSYLWNTTIVCNLKNRLRREN